MIAHPCFRTHLESDDMLQGLADRNSISIFHPTCIPTLQGLNWFFNFRSAFYRV